ncbi:MAG: DesA family fatty acid desaturase [Burkholderiaceae bacterium]
MNILVEFVQYGLTGWSWPAIVVYTLAVTHITIAGVTIFLHRCQAHRAVELHPAVSHFFRFWLWMTTGMVTKEWAAIHRKHHAKCETEDDPHSPITKGLSAVVWRGADLYRDAAKDRELVDRYGHGCPDDWLERNLYTGRSALGVSLMLIINVALFGVVGAAVWAVQMMWIPFFAAGVINGIGHFWGYRNFKSPDTSANIFPWGILIGGEELHNNHHAHATSPKLSSKWYEFDIGWLYIRILESVGMAKPRHLPMSDVALNPNKFEIDADTIAAVISSKYELMARLAKLAKKVKVPVAGSANGANASSLLSQDLVRRASDLRQEFEAIWSRRSLSVEQAIAALQQWCQQAEASGIAAYEEFSRRLRTYTIKPAIA